MNKLFKFDEKCVQEYKNTFSNGALNDNSKLIKCFNNFNDEATISFTKSNKTLNYIKDEELYLIGTDEAGRGPGAGPVFAAAVCFPSLNTDLKKMLEKLNDSKQLSEKTREELYEILIKNCVYSVNQGSVEDIEKFNILKTSLLTMKKCVEEIKTKLKTSNLIVLVDGNKKIPQAEFNQKTVIKGDSKSAVIAAASVIAKVERDRFMNMLDKEYPQYDWGENKGYLTQKHLAAVDKYGLTKWHRKKFFEKHFEKSRQMSLF